jgi:hypothetical protein
MPRQGILDKTWRLPDVEVGKLGGKTLKTKPAMFGGCDGKIPNCLPIM